MALKGIRDSRAQRLWGWAESYNMLMRGNFPNFYNPALNVTPASGLRASFEWKLQFIYLLDRRKFRRSALNEFHNGSPLEALK